jgi:hydroxyacylglutathione hydrolase
MSFSIETFPVGIYQCNCSIIACKKTGEAIIVDPGAEAERIIKYVEKRQLKVRYILHTHAHLDHFGATYEVKKCCRGKTVMHKQDMFLYDIADMQSQMLRIPGCKTDKIDHFINDEEHYEFGRGKIQAIVTPGHTPGSTCFRLNTGKQQLIFSGDTLFKRSVGRTDLPGGNARTLKKSIKERLFTLDGDSKVIPGHGAFTRIGEEKRQNPFVRI